MVFEAMKKSEYRILRIRNHFKKLEGSLVIHSSALFMNRLTRTQRKSALLKIKYLIIDRAGARV